MSELLQLKGKNLIKLLVVVFIVFTLIGGFIGYVISPTLNKDEPVVTPTPEVQTTAPVSYQGTVTYLGEDMYPQDKVTYSLTDPKGNDIIWLRSNDQKLSIAQGLFVTVVGRKVKSIDGKHDILQVTEVTLKNGSN